MVGVVEGTEVLVLVRVGVNVAAEVCVSVGAFVVTVTDGVCCKSWGKAVRVEATMEATAWDGSIVVPCPFGKLQALAKMTEKIVTAIAKTFFIGAPPLGQAQ